MSIKVLYRKTKILNKQSDDDAHSLNKKEKLKKCLVIKDLDLRDFYKIFSTLHV